MPSGDGTRIHAYTLARRVLSPNGSSRACRRNRSRRTSGPRPPPTPPPEQQHAPTRSARARPRRSLRACATRSRPMPPPRTASADRAAPRDRRSLHRDRRASPPDPPTPAHDHGHGDVASWATSPLTTRLSDRAHPPDRTTHEHPRGPPHACHHRSPTSADASSYASSRKCPSGSGPAGFATAVSPTRRVFSWTRNDDQRTTTERSGLTAPDRALFHHELSGSRPCVLSRDDRVDRKLCVQAFNYAPFAKAGVVQR